MARLICIVIGYVFGMFQTAYIYGRMHGIDIRQHGSGNAGTTNTLRVLGKKAGAVVFIGDVLKCVLAMVVVGLLYKNVQPEQEILYLLKLYAAAGAILGHNFPFFLKFKGGKGMAATAGLILFWHPAFIPMGCIVFLGIFFTTHYVSLGSICVYIAFVIELVIIGQLGFLGMSQNELLETYAIAVFLALMAIWRHRENIQRLRQGCERKTYLTKANREA